LAADPRFATNAGRLRERRVLEVELARAIAPWRAAELLAAMGKAGVPGGPINSIDEVLADPQVAAREMLRAMRRDDGTEVQVIGFPGRLSRSPASYRLAPPRLGQDTRAVLEAELGLGGAEIEALRTAGVVALGETTRRDPGAERTP
jgi:crotonobetainyl-CoA:carnitine CoA-transferase CaiB-like acyl-CoA transferase